MRIITYHSRTDKRPIQSQIRIFFTETEKEEVEFQDYKHPTNVIFNLNFKKKKKWFFAQLQY